MTERTDEMCKHTLMAGTEYRLVARHQLPRDLASAMVRGLSQFLTLLATERRLLSPPTLIDFAWHEALIDTSEYTAFCAVYFREFLHHHPPRHPDGSGPNKDARTSETVTLARAMFGDALDATVWRRSSVHVVSHIG